jgi:hypothetical protein
MGTDYARPRRSSAWRKNRWSARTATRRCSTTRARGQANTKSGRLREIANVAQSPSEQARLNSRAELFDGLARVIALNGRASPVIAFGSRDTSL